MLHTVGISSHSISINSGGLLFSLQQMSKLGQEGSKGPKAMQLLEPGLKLATIACRWLGNQARLEGYSVLYRAVGKGKRNKRESVSPRASSECSSHMTGWERDASELLCARSPWPALPRPPPQAPVPSCLDLAFFLPSPSCWLCPSPARSRDSGASSPSSMS